MNKHTYLKNSTLKLVLLDFDGVLSQGRFYSTIKKDSPEIYEKIANILFSKEAWPFSSRWMRGEFSYKDLHREIAPRVGVEVEYLNNKLVESVMCMKLNTSLVEFSKKLRSSGIQVVIFTDNMDIFDEVFVRYANLDTLFDKIFSSSAYKKLKLENNAEFLRDVFAEMGIRPSESLFLDDSIKIGPYMEKLGGKFYHYDKYVDGHQDFLIWFNQAYSV